MLTLTRLFEFVVGIATTSFGGGGGGTSTQYSQVQNYSPEEVARRTRLMDEAEGIYGRTRSNVVGSPYPGSVPVGPSAATQAGWGMLQESIPRIGALAGGAGGAAMRGTGEDILYADSNPYLQSWINAAIRPIQNQFLDAGGILSGIRGSSMDAGGQGTSTRQGIAEGIATARALQEMGDISSEMAGAGYGQGLEHQARMSALAPAIQAMQTAPGQVAGAVGTQQEGYAQQLADYEAAARMWGLDREWAALQPWANIVFGAGSGGSTSTATTALPRGNQFQNALGAAMMGYSLFNMMNPGTNPLLAAAGAMMFA